MTQYISYGDQDAMVVEFNICRTDEAGFHVEAVGELGTLRRTTTRDGMDAYAYRCRRCGVVGDIIEGRFVAR